MRVCSPPNPTEMSSGAFIGFGTDADHRVLYRSILEGMAFDVRMIVEGISKINEICTSKAYYLSSKIDSLGGYKVLYKNNFLNEFVVESTIPSKILSKKCLKEGIHIHPISENKILIAVTEKRSNIEKSRSIFGAQVKQVYTRPDKYQ